MKTYADFRAEGLRAVDAFRAANADPTPEIEWDDYSETKGTIVVDGWEVAIELTEDDIGDAGADFLGSLTWMHHAYQDDCPLTGNDGRHGTFPYSGDRDHGHITLERSEEAHYADLRQMKLGKAEARDLAHTYAQRDLERLQGLERGDWGFVGIIATVKDATGTILGYDSCYGIESDSGDYIADVALECARTAVDQAKTALEAIA